MNTETMILNFLQAEPGMTTSQIANGIGAGYMTVRRVIGGMTALGEVTKDFACRYYPAEAATAKDEKYLMLCRQATELEEKKLWRRAASVWLKAMDSTGKAELRQKAVLRRARCVRAGEIQCPNYGGISAGVMNSQSTWEDLNR